MSANKKVVNVGEKKVKNATANELIEELKKRLEDARDCLESDKEDAVYELEEQIEEVEEAIDTIECLRVDLI
jgi:hypothetical protein